MNTPVREVPAIESLLAGDPDIAEVVSVRAPGGQSVVAVACHDYYPAVELRDRVREQVNQSDLPDRIVVVPTLPRDEAGEVQVDQVMDHPEAQVAHFAAPRTPTEQSVAGIWCEALGRTWVAVEDNFSDLGGDSMSALFLLDLVGERLDVDLSFDDLLAADSLRALAEMVDQRR